MFNDSVCLLCYLAFLSIINCKINLCRVLLFLIIVVRLLHNWTVQLSSVLSCSLPITLGSCNSFSQWDYTALIILAAVLVTSLDAFKKYKYEFVFLCFSCWISFSDALSWSVATPIITLGMVSRLPVTMDIKRPFYDVFYQPPWPSDPHYNPGRNCVPAVLRHQLLMNNVRTHKNSMLPLFSGTISSHCFVGESFDYLP